jgi:hypothetical protein
LEESNIYKPNWSNTFLQEASNLVQMKLQQEAELNQRSENLADNHNNDESSHADPEAERQRLADELVEEEEKEKKKKKKGKRN